MVYNIKSQQARLVSLTPSDSWGGAGLLGVTIRLDNYAGAEDRLIRVLTVEPKSPAAVAGLVPAKDFLLGTTHQTLDSTATLAALLHEYQDRVIEVYVYNVDSDVVRVVALMPTLSWGGPGLLGAEVGVGYLHRLPHSVRSTEGASVQRKVRYVGTSDGGNGNHTSIGNSSTTQQLLGSSKKSAVLELEPQLEMEPPEESEEDCSTTDMSSVALEENSTHGHPSQRPLPRDKNAANNDQQFPIATPPPPSKKVIVETVRGDDLKDDNVKLQQQQQQQQQQSSAFASTTARPNTFRTKLVAET